MNNPALWMEMALAIGCGVAVDFKHYGPAAYLALATIIHALAFVRERK